MWQAEGVNYTVVIFFCGIMPLKSGLCLTPREPYNAPQSVSIMQKVVEYVHQNCLLLPSNIGNGGRHVGLFRICFGEYHNSVDKIRGFVPLRFHPRHNIYPDRGTPRRFSQEGPVS